MGLFMKRKVLQSQFWVEAVPPVLEREAGLLGRWDLAIWCPAVWLSRTVRIGSWLFNSTGSGAGSPMKGKEQCAHLPAVYVCDHYEVLTFATGTLKSTFLQFHSAAATGPESWVPNGPAVQRGGESRVPVKVLWCSEWSTEWEGCFCQCPDHPLSKIIIRKIVLLHICLLRFSILMCFIIYVIYYTETNVHNWSQGKYAHLKDECLHFLSAGVTFKKSVEPSDL